MTRRQFAWLLAAVALGAALPLHASPFALTLTTEILIAAVFVSGVNLLLGYTGLVPLGIAMFLGLGAYGLAVFSKLLGLPLWLAIPATLAVVALLASVIGAVCTRTRDIEFLLITLAFNQMFFGAAIKVKETGGSDGLPGIARPDLSAIGLDAGSEAGFYLLVLLVTAVTIGLLIQLVNSPFGSVLIGIRENENRMVAMSYRVSYYKVGAFVIAALLAAIAGILTAQYTHFVNPDMLSWQVGGEAVLMVIIGGRRHVLGGLIGAAIFILVKHLLSEVTQDYLLYFGLFFMACVVFFRDGVTGLLQRARWGLAR